MLKTTAPALLVLALTLTPLTGCGDNNTQADYPTGVAPMDESTTEQTPTAPGPGPGPQDDAADATPDTPPADAPDTGPDTLTVEGLVYTVPEGWTVGGPRPMRTLTLTTDDGLDVAVGYWPNGVGGMETNFNRWFGQAGYNPADADQIAQARAGFETFQLGDAQATWAPLLNGAPGRGKPMIAVWAPRGDTPTALSETWTIKITGDEATLLDKQDELRAWAESLSFE